MRKCDIPSSSIAWQLVGFVCLALFILLVYVLSSPEFSFQR